MRPGDQAIRPNNKNPWAGRVRSRHRLKSVLRGSGLHHSFFTKARTKARQKNWNEAIQAVYESHGADMVRAIREVWGR